MKKLLLLFVLVTNLNSFANNCVMCAIDGIYIYPNKKTISIDELIIIEGYANSQKIVKNLSKRKVFLVSKDDKVILNFQKTYIGEMELTQSLFAPSIDLKPNTNYYLEFENETEEETRLLKKWNSQKKISEKIQFKTNYQKTDKNNNKNIKYNFKNTNYSLFGCGPAVFANFTVSNFKTNKILHKVELLNLKNQTKKTYYLYSENSKISIGHGMCSGAFTFRGNDAYRIRFTPINSSGKESKSSSWISFENPYKNVKNTW